MKPLGLILACVYVGAALAPAVAVRAEPSAILAAAGDFITQPGPPPASTTGRTLEWDPHKGRWGLKLGVDERTDRPPGFRDLAPGVFYKLSPRLHIGGDVTLAPDSIIGYPNNQFLNPQAPNPRVRLETTFKF